MNAESEFSVLVAVGVVGCAIMGEIKTDVVNFNLIIENDIDHQGATDWYLGLGGDTKSNVGVYLVSGIAEVSAEWNTKYRQVKAEKQG
jgi:hypothetical protein